MRWTKTYLMAGAVLGLVLLASVLYPALSAQIGAHATPSLSLLHNFLSANTDGVAMATAALLAPAPRLAELLTKLKAMQTEFKDKAMPEPKAKEFEDMAAEAKVLQSSFDRDVQLREMEQRSQAVPDPLLPPNSQPLEETKEEKEAKSALRKKAVVGYLRLGEFVTAQKSFHDFRAARMPKAQFTLCQVKDIFQPLVALTAEDVIQLKQTTPTLGDGVIEPTRVPEIVRALEHDRLVLRDILNISPTTSSAVRFTRIVQYVRGALAVARGTEKPHSELVMDTVISPVHTIAVWMPVDNEQLDDLPALQGLINTELLYDVDKHLEELCTYGSGTGEEFLGLCVDPLVLACRHEVGDTLIDTARRGITDVLTAGYEPTGILMHPRDWETVVLAKGSDNRYVWVVVTEGATQRLWGVPVIETVACQDFAGNATEERNLIVGDFRRGAVLWDRMQSAVSVGWIDDQFIKNQRTILAELRAAFGIWRPGAFRKHMTQEAETS